MKIGIVVHGPNIIDSGYAIKIIDLLSKWGDVSCRLGGTMGRTAVIDSFLEDKIDISRKLLPSDSLKLFYDEGYNIIFLLNYGKSKVTGHVFGYKVVNHFFNKISKKDISLIQIERPGEEDGSVIVWNSNLNNTEKIAKKIAEIFNLKIVSPSEIYKDNFLDNNDSEYMRVIHGVSPNENILINGVVIGKSTSNKVTLVSKNVIIIDIIGGDLKKHGIEKLGKVNLEKAIIKTGLLRKSEVKPRIISKNKNRDYFTVGFLDHAGEDVYRYKDIDLVVTIGDDTTLIASDILYRFNIPIIGITDGDLDKVVQKGFKMEDSLIFQLEKGHDDIVGDEIFKKVFNENNTLKFPLTNKKEIIKMIKFEIIEIINNMNCKYITNGE